MSPEYQIHLDGSATNFFVSTEQLGDGKWIISLFNTISFTPPGEMPKTFNVETQALEAIKNFLAETRDTNPEALTFEPLPEES